MNVSVKSTPIARRPALAVISAIVILMGMLQTTVAQSLLDTVQQRGTVIIGVRFDTPPFGIINAQGENEGFGVDLAYAIGEALGVEVELRQVTARTRIPLIETGGVDLVVDSTLITRERELSVDFTLPYYMDQLGNRMLVRADSGINGYEDLAGKRVAVVQGSVAIARLERNAPDAELVIFQEYPTAFLAVQRGQADAVFAQDYIIDDMLAQAGSGFRGTDPLLENQLIGMIVRENDSDWRDAINFVLVDLWKNGTYLEIYRKNFDSDPNPQFSLPDWDL